MGPEARRGVAMVKGMVVRIWRVRVKELSRQTAGLGGSVG